MADIETNAGASERAPRKVTLPYPRRRAIRWVLRRLAGLIFFLVCDLRITGRENIPSHGPAILIANHFHFADPVALIWTARRQLEFVGGFRFFVGPRPLYFLTDLWGYIIAHRGGYSRYTLDASMSVLEQDGLVGIFPEGGAWTDVLRPARGGSAFLAVESGAPVIPIGLDGLDRLFREWRPTITIRIGKPIGPFKVDATARQRRREIDRIGETMMRAIAELIPEKHHGVYSDDPLLRAEAEKLAEFPFDKQGMRGL